MSHFNEYYDSREACRETGDCTEFEQIAKERITDARMMRNQELVFIGLSTVVTVVFFSLFLVATKNALIKKLLSRLLQIMALVAPTLLAVTIGVAVGFWISFSACYKQSCSSVESGAIVTIPLLGLALGLAASIPLWAKRKSIHNKLLTAQAGWRRWGVALIVLTVIFGAYIFMLRIGDFERYSEYLLQY